MIAVPFIYFTLLTAWLYKKKGTIYSIPIIITALYALISLGSVCIDYFNVYSASCTKVPINIFPTFLYCFFITLSIYPFIKNKDEKINKIQIISNTFYIDIIVYIYAFLFLFSIIFLTSDLIRNIARLALYSDTKKDIMLGNISYISVSGWKKLIASKILQFSSSSIFLIFFYYYSICFLKKKSWYIILIFLGSMTTCFVGLLTVDRSRIVYWILTFIIGFVFFQRFMTKKKRNNILKIALILLSSAVLYMVVVNSMRYSDTVNVESQDFLLIYWGQSFINFCKFFEYLKLDSYSYHITFPLLYAFLNDNASTITQSWNFHLQNKTGFMINIFSTFLGDNASGIGMPLSLIWCSMFSLISTKWLRRKSLNSISIFKLFLTFVLLNVPYLGIFVYYYHNAYLNIGTIGFLIVTYLTSITNKK